MADVKFQTSFIPKKPVSDSPKTKSGVNIFMLLSVIIFLISIGMGGYVYLYKKILIQRISDSQKVITENKTGLVTDSTTIENILQLDSRIKVAKSLLEKHSAPSPFFSFLEQRTIKSIRFKNFSFSSTGSDSSQNTTVQMTGVAQDFKIIASQADEFGKPEWRNIIKEPKISSISLNQDGTVSFVFSAIIVPDFLSYSSKLNTSI